MSKRFDYGLSSSKLTKHGTDSYRIESEYLIDPEEENEFFYEFEDETAEVLYVEYLYSDDWNEKREAVWLRSKGLCELCGKTASQVHHIKYSPQWKNQKLEDLIAVCRRCHELQHHHPH